MSTGSTLSHLECSACHKVWEAEELHNVCPQCGKPLLARYDMSRARESLQPAALKSREPTLWRYREVLPVRDKNYIFTLGEGWTPLLRLPQLEKWLGLAPIFAKDESQNPTNSFKARGLCVAVSRAKELGASTFALPSAGNAAGALSAYAACAQARAHVFMPEDVPAPFVEECRWYGAQVELVPGLITDCARKVARGVQNRGWFDVSTLKEPYRVEGKKTMGYELFEQMGTLPDVILYPTGGGTGLIGMWKAFEEMETLGWIDQQRPRMVAVQASGCAPIVRAFHSNQARAAPWPEAQTLAAGLRVPAAIGDFLMLQVLRQSQGTAVAVEDREILNAVHWLAHQCGLFCAPEGAATLVALQKLKETGWISRGEKIVLFITGGAYKYLPLLSSNKK